MTRLRAIAIGAVLAMGALTTASCGLVLGDATAGTTTSTTSDTAPEVRDQKDRPVTASTIAVPPPAAPDPVTIQNAKLELLLRQSAQDPAVEPCAIGSRTVLRGFDAFSEIGTADADQRREKVDAFNETLGPLASLYLRGSALSSLDGDLDEFGRQTAGASSAVEVQELLIGFLEAHQSELDDLLGRFMDACPQAASFLPPDPIGPAIVGIRQGLIDHGATD